MLTCESALGTCASCYGRSLATGKLVDVGEAVGIIAAQSIGEPGTQLTMRTFHTGGIAGDDITHGLPRVAELFEARVPKGMAPIAETTGRVRIEDQDDKGARRIVVTPDDGSEEVEYPISRRARLRVEEGEHVAVGQQLVSGAVNPHDVLRIMGPREVQLHLVREVQEVYRSQGVAIHDKHIEVIVRQMLKRITVIESGATEFLPGSLPERGDFEAENRRVVAEGGEPASGRPVLMGITKASLATESWLSAASFQETTRVLTDAAISARSDSLVGLKENVIIGKLIPAGTGIARYRNVDVEPTEEARAAAYSMSGYNEDDYYGFGNTEWARPSRWTSSATTTSGSRHALPARGVVPSGSAPRRVFRRSGQFVVAELAQPVEGVDLAPGRVEVLGPTVPAPAQPGGGGVVGHGTTVWVRRWPRQAKLAGQHGTATPVPGGERPSVRRCAGVRVHQLGGLGVQGPARTHDSRPACAGRRCADA